MYGFETKLKFEDCMSIAYARHDLFLSPIDKRSKKLLRIVEKIILDNGDYLRTHCFINDDFQLFLKYQKKEDAKVEWHEDDYYNIRFFKMWLSMGFGVKASQWIIEHLLQKCVAYKFFPEKTKEEVDAFLVMNKLTERL